MGSLILHHLKERPLSHDGLIFCGDSTSFVDCLTGEGISYALEAGGIIAPGVIEKAQNAGISSREVLKEYETQVYEAFKADYTDGVKLRKRLLSSDFTINMAIKKAAKDERVASLMAGIIVRSVEKKEATVVEV